MVEGGKNEATESHPSATSKKKGNSISTFVFSFVWGPIYIAERWMNAYYYAASSINFLVVQSVATQQAITITEKKRVVVLIDIWIARQMFVLISLKTAPTPPRL